VPQVPAITELYGLRGAYLVRITRRIELALLDGTRISMFGLSDGLDIGNVISIYDHDGEIWTGGQSGLELFERGHFRRLSVGRERAAERCLRIVLAKNGDLWLKSSICVVAYCC